MKNAIHIARVLCLSIAIGFLGACSHSPSRAQAEQMRLARQADANYRGGKFDMARKQYASLVKMQPKFAAGYVRLGVIAYRDGQKDLARSQFELALKADPRNAQASFNLAMLHLDDAARLLDDYIQRSPPGQTEHARVLLSQLRSHGSGE